jgi:pimeloyl-ACP methyl ester carboxylesterase
MREFDVLDQLGVVECPTLVCVGELDPITPVAAAREIVDALPDGLAQLEILDDAGHFAWRDAPDRYWPILLDFVAATAVR